MRLGDSEVTVREFVAMIALLVAGVGGRHRGRGLDDCCARSSRESGRNAPDRTAATGGTSTLLSPLETRAGWLGLVAVRLADDLRAEHAMGWGLIELATPFEGNRVAVFIGRLDAADSLDEQAERWEMECRTGEPNRLDRSRIGM